jgi:DNA primase
LIEAQEGAPKYLNSPDTPLFDKGRTLFNLERAAPAARKAKRLIVVEGYMDVVALANAGVDEAVAPMGTALTETQIELLWRHAESPVLCLDGDSAGRRAALRAAARALPLLKPGHTLSVAQMPPGQDPDDLLRVDGRDRLEALLGSAAPLTELLWQGERDAAPLNTPEAKAGLKERLLAHADTITHPDIKSLYRRELLARYSAFAFPSREERPAPAKFVRGEARRDTVKGLSPGSAATLRLLATQQSREELAKAVLHGFTRFPQAIASCAGLIAQLAERYPSLSETVDRLLDGADMLEEPPAGAICNSTGRSEAVRYVFLLEDADPSRACESLAEAASLLVERPALETALAAATARFASDPEGAFAEQQRLLKRKLEFESRLRHITGQAT